MANTAELKQKSLPREYESAIYKNSMIVDIVVSIKAITTEQVSHSLGVSGLHSLCVFLLAVPRSLSLKDSWLHIKTKFI